MEQIWKRKRSQYPSYDLNMACWDLWNRGMETTEITKFRDNLLQTSFAYTMDRQKTKQKIYWNMFYLLTYLLTASRSYDFRGSSSTSWRPTDPFYIYSLLLLLYASLSPSRDKYHQPVTSSAECSVCSIYSSIFSICMPDTLLLWC